MKTIEELKKANQELKELMEKTAKGNDLDPEMIIYDGVYDKYLKNYIEAKHHIMWILKEAYEDKGKYKWDVGNFNEETGALKKEGTTLRRTCLISYAILKECNYKKACEADIKDLADAGHQVAIINICKIKTTPGTYSADDITSDFEIWKGVTEKQIELYEPEIIICGNTLVNFDEKTSCLKRTIDNKYPLNNKSISPNTEKKYCYYRENGRLYINICHPSARDIPKINFKVNWENCVNEIVDIIMHQKK